MQKKNHLAVILAALVGVRVYVLQVVVAAALKHAGILVTKGVNMNAMKDVSSNAQTLVSGNL